MKCIKIGRSRVSGRILREAVAALRRGEVVAYPTDTAYGLAADPANGESVRRIFRMKGREKGKPLPLIAGSLAHARKHVLLSGHPLSLARRHWPGPLTFVAPLRRGRGSAAIRIPASRWARALAKMFGGPVTSTSANLSGNPPLYSGDAVRRAFSGRKFRPDLILDAGPLPRRPVSTIVRFSRGKIEVLRQGAIKVKYR